MNNKENKETDETSVRALALDEIKSIYEKYGLAGISLVSHIEGEYVATRIGRFMPARLKEEEDVKDLISLSKAVVKNLRSETNKLEEATKMLQAVSIMKKILGLDNEDDEDDNDNDNDNKPKDPEPSKFAEMEA